MWNALLKWALEQSIWMVLALWHKCLHKPATTMDTSWTRHVLFLTHFKKKIKVFLHNHYPLCCKCVVINPLVKGTTKFHWFICVLFPSLSTGEPERVSVNTSAMLETATVDALKKSLQSEVSSLSQLAVQNCWALDYLLTSQGGICILVSTNWFLC